MMSPALTEVMAALPSRLARDIAGYIRSVRDALPSIFREANVDRTTDLENQLLFVAAIRKLYWLCSAGYWMVENSLSLVGKSGITSVRSGSLILSKNSAYYLRMQALLDDLEELVGRQNLEELVRHSPYSEALKQLAHGH